jgi:ABC-type bacteriocin/lantibiotic exporter with double-glycine peptidase domain
MVLRRHGEPVASSWTHLFDDLARSLGLRVIWRVSHHADVKDAIQPELPALTWTSDGWRMLTRNGNMLSLQRFPGGGMETPAPIAHLPMGAVAWAMVEPALPGDVMAGEGKLSPWERLMGLLQAERRDLGLVVLYAIGVGVLGLAGPLTVQVIVNTVALGAFRQQLYVLTILLLVCLGLAAFLQALQRYVVELLQRRLFVRMVADLSERLPRVELQTYERQSGPELVNRFFDVLTVQKSMSSLLMDGIAATFSALSGMAILALYHPALLGFDVVLIISVVLLLFGWSRPATDSAVYESKKKYAVVSWLEEIAAHPRLYKLGGGSELAARRSDLLAREWLGARQKHFRGFFTQYTAALALQAAANSALLLAGGYLVIEGQLTLGQLVAAELIVAGALAGFAKFADKLETVYDLLAAVDKLGQLVDLPLERTHGWRAAPPTLPLALRVRGLKQTTSEGRTLFDNLGFDVRRGERTLIVAGDGSGRSALADVLLGLREPEEGRIMVDEADVQELCLDSLRERIALVRGTEHVSGTIAENVSLGRALVGPAEVRAALKTVGLGQIIEDLADRVDTKLNASGSPLTENERARLAVARAIAPNPRLLIVDGLLDVLDEPTRLDLLGALTSHRNDWTLIVLSRDPALASRFDRTLELRDGGCHATDGGAE